LDIINIYTNLIPIFSSLEIGSSLYDKETILLKY